MTKIELLEEIKEALQKDDELNLDMQLNDIEEWDSLAKISIISLYDQLFDIVITADKLKSCQTIGDIVELVSNNLDS